MKPLSKSHFKTQKRVSLLPNFFIFIFLVLQSQFATAQFFSLPDDWNFLFPTTSTTQPPYESSADPNKANTALGGPRSAPPGQGPEFEDRGAIIPRPTNTGGSPNGGSGQQDPPLGSGGLPTIGGPNPSGSGNSTGGTRPSFEGLHRARPWLAEPISPTVDNQTKPSKENIDMTCASGTKCVRFKACLSKNCDESKKVSQLYAFRSTQPSSAPQRRVARATVSGGELCWVNQNDANPLQWSQTTVASQFGGTLPAGSVQCSMSGPCTTEGAVGGECGFEYVVPTLKGLELAFNPYWRPQNPDEDWEHRTFSIGKSVCARVPAGTCTAAVNRPSCAPKVQTLKLPASVSCISPGCNETCSVEYDLSQLEGFASIDKSIAKFQVLFDAYANRYGGSLGNCTIKRNSSSLGLDSGVTVKADGITIHRSEGGRKKLFQSARLEGSNLTATHGASGWGKVCARACISNVEVLVTEQSSDPACAAPPEPSTPTVPGGSSGGGGSGNGLGLDPCGEGPNSCGNQPTPDIRSDLISQ